jgi:hypothetical protein
MAIYVCGYCGILIHCDLERLPECPFAPCLGPRCVEIMKNLKDGILLACSDKCHGKIGKKRGEVIQQICAISSRAVKKSSICKKLRRETDELNGLIAEELRGLLGAKKKSSYFHGDFHAHLVRSERVLEIRYKNRNGKKKRKRG